MAKYIELTEAEVRSYGGKKCWDDLYFIGRNNDNKKLILKVDTTPAALTGKLERSEAEMTSKIADKRGEWYLSDTDETNLPKFRKNTSAIAFTGTNDYMKQSGRSRTTIMDAMATGSWSLSFYIKDTAGGSGNFTTSYILTKMLTSMAYLTVDTYGGNIRIGAGNGKAVVMQSVFPAGLVKGQWYHVVLTCDRTGNSVIKCYVNGSEVSANSGAIQVKNTVNLISAAGSSDVGLGAFIFGSLALAYYNFSIDEIAVWNTVLSASAVSDIYTKVSDLTENYGSYQAKSNLQRYYKLDESTGTTAADAVSRGDAFQLVNSPNWTRPAY